MEHIQIIQLFASALKLDGLAGNGQHGKRCTAAGIAIGLGEDDAIHAHRLVEGLSHVDGILTGHGVHHQQGLVHGNGGLDVHQLLHQHFIDLQAACGIQNHDVVAVVLGVCQRLTGDLRRLCAGQGEHRRTGLFAHHLQLVNSSGAVDIAGHQHGAAALLDIELGKLCRVGGFAVALQAAEHDDRLALVLDVQAGSFAAAHEGYQLLIDDLDHLLGGGQTFHDLLTHGALGHLCAEVLGNLVVDISFQQSHPHLAHGGFDICLGQLTVTAQLFEYTGKAVGQGFKCHCAVLLSKFDQLSFASSIERMISSIFVSVSTYSVVVILARGPVHSNRVSMTSCSSCSSFCCTRR